MMKPWHGKLALLLTALIWGMAFAAQKSGMADVSPCVFNACRQVLAVLMLLPVIAVLDKMAGKKLSFWGTPDPAARRHLLCGGFLCGLMLTLASLLQQYGLLYSRAGKAGFLTSLYLVIVAVLGVFFHRDPGRRLWMAVIIALGGTFLLAGNGSWSGFSTGDWLLLGCAFGFALHILVVDHFVRSADPVRLSWLQFLTTGILSGIAGLAAGDSFSWTGIRQAGGALLYCGIFSSGVAFTLQIVGQKTVHPVTASLLMCLESVFSVLGGCIFLHERFTGMELAGCTAIFAGVLLAQIPVKSKSTDQEKKTCS